MKVLIACEESQAVCKAFREKGHEAYSCDIIECSGGHPEWHIQRDVLKVLNGHCIFVTEDAFYHQINSKWDLIIAHPPCTYLSNAGARHLWKGHKLNEERYKKGLEAKKFFMALYNADCEKICIENPIPSKVYELPPYSQTVQPYEHGHPVTKKTCLWLKGLPVLMPSNIVAPEKGRILQMSNGTTRRSCWCMDQGKAFGGEERARLRAKTFEGIARAMAEQWGGDI